MSINKRMGTLVSGQLKLFRWLSLWIAPHLSPGRNDGHKKTILFIKISKTLTTHSHPFNMNMLIAMYKAEQVIQQSETMSELWFQTAHSGFGDLCTENFQAMRA